MNFLEQFDQLRLKTPRLYNINIGSENSDYCTHSDKNKNCYLLFAANFNEDCYYGGIIVNSRDCVECNYCQYCELCFECVDIDHCYHCTYSQNLQNCSDCAFSYDLIGCHDCFGCVGLRQKSYSLFNESFSKEEYKKRILAFDVKNPNARTVFISKIYGAQKIQRISPSPMGQNYAMSVFPLVWGATTVISVITFAARAIASTVSSASTAKIVSAA